MSDKEWLASLKVGDKVAISIRNGYRIGEVSRLTKTQIVLKDGNKFNRESGYLVGRNACNQPVYIQSITDEILKEWRRNWLLKEFYNYDIKQISNENLEKIVALLKELGVEKE